MLASDEQGGEFDALRFSLASDIVELLVLTGDEVFLQTLREAVGGARRLWHVPSADKVSDLLVAGGVGILVLDVQALVEAPTVFVAQIKRQFPDLVVVVAGTRDAETSLAGLISDGAVYRFIHKPMSPGRAKLFADAAVKKYEEQRSRTASIPPLSHKPRRAVLIGGAAGMLAVVIVVAWVILRPSDDGSDGPRISDPARAPAVESPELLAAAAALAANRLTGPPGENALELYLQAQARNPADPRARAGLAEVRERLLARAENALLEERLDEAAGAIETARRSGVESGRIVFLTAQLAKSRDQVRAAQAAARTLAPPKAGTGAAADAVPSLLVLAAQRMEQARLVEPEGDSALFYVREALRLDPQNDAAEEAEKALALRLLAEAHAAVDRRDFAHAAAWLEAAKAIAAPVNIEAGEASLAAARRQADADAWDQLMRSAGERMQQDRLIEPDGDSAKYYLTTLRGQDPNHAGLAAAFQELGIRLAAKARRALSLEQLDAARSWLEEAHSIGFASAEGDSVQHDLDAAAGKQAFMANIVAAGELTLVKSVKPDYPKKANAGKIEGWVELDFTVAESGAVKDIAVHAASSPGVFDSAAIAALSQWRYMPVVKDSTIVPQRARLRIRFTLAN